MFSIYGISGPIFTGTLEALGRLPSVMRRRPARSERFHAWSGACGPRRRARPAPRQTRGKRAATRSLAILGRRSVGDPPEAEVGAG